ncbi:MAG: hypothetical protein R2807_11125 [Chitinophagales bacterium]
MIAVMGAEQLAIVMQMVSESALKSGQPYDENQAAQMKEFMKMKLKNK